MADTQQYTSGLVGLGLTLLAAAGYYTKASTLLFFTVNPLHNHIHLAFGILGIVSAVLFHGIHARLYNKTVGVISVVAAVAGIIFAKTFAEVLNIGLADNLFSLALGLLLLYVGYKVHPQPV